MALICYSSFFTNPAGLLESFRAFTIYVGRGMAVGTHTEPWYYYLGILAWSSSGGLRWSEGLVLGLALVGAVAATRGRRAQFWPWYICLYTVLAILAFSAVRYKTPWNLLPFYVGVVLLAGTGASTVMARARPRAMRALLGVVLVGASGHLALQNWRANFRYPADPRNPYVYAQTTPDFLRLVQRIDDLAALHPDHSRMLVRVIAGPYEQWPLPWYLRKMERVGYWRTAAEAGSLGGTPVVVASGEQAASVERALGDQYVSEFYGLRPNVLLEIFIDQDLWRRYLDSVAFRGGET